MKHRANFNPTWELGSTSIAQALPSNMEKTFSQAQLPTKKTQKTTLNKNTTQNTNKKLGRILKKSVNNNQKKEKNAKFCPSFFLIC
jgi:hypothetical protein